MKRYPLTVLAFLLIFALFFSACSKQPQQSEIYEITVDKSGVASWSAVEGAIEYEYNIVDAEYSSMGEQFTTETSIQLPEGYSVHVRAVLENGEYGDWMTSEYFGEPVIGFDGQNAGVLPEGMAAEITLDASGVASWSAVDGAIKYEYLITDAEYTSKETLYTTELSVQVPEGYSVHVRPVFENGEFGFWMTSDYFGTPVVGFGEENVYIDDIQLYVDMAYDVKWEDLKTYEVIANINYDTVQTRADGTVYFEANGPRGDVMRFEGTGITVAEGAISIESDGRLSALDAIGRICAVDPMVSDTGNSENWIKFSGGYTFTDSTGVDSMDELFYVWGFENKASDFLTEDSYCVSHMDFQPNFISISANGLNKDAFTLSELIVYYDESTYHTGIRLMALETSFYGSYLEDEYYDPSKEVYNLADRIYDFYLLVLPELADEKEPYHPNVLNDMITPRCLLGFDDDRFTVGDVKDADGNVLDKNNAVLSIGSTVEVTLGNYTCDVLLPVLERYGDARYLHDLIPYSNIYSKGDVTALVVPVYWQDEPEKATDETLDLLRANLGRVVDLNGIETDYSDRLTDRFSLSEYYDIASYGNYHIRSFVTDWFAAPFDFAEMMNQGVENGAFHEKFNEWLFDTYPNMDWSLFDSDANGFFDAVILVNTGTVGDTMNAGTFSYAQHWSPGYTGEGAGTQEKPAIKNHISMNEFFLRDSTLIHEYGHAFGLIDYYDVTYSGIDAVGRYDMQSASVGDWNAYSKYAVGWIEPEIISDLAVGESKEITIGSLAETGDAIVIPSAGTSIDGPFNEYILIDLFTPDGVNAYDASDFGLDDTAGVRIYHVNASMEKRILTGEDGKEYPIGTVSYANAYDKSGKYMIELIQSGKDNTFTDVDNLRTQLSKDDLFYEGDVFTAEAYKEFFVNGRMDDRSAFGYSVEIVDITQNAAGDYSAVIRITRQ